MQHYASPLLLGPPPSETLLELVVHMFTEEEAQLVQHLPPLRLRTAAEVARRAGRPAAEAKKLLDRLAFTKLVVFASGLDRKYSLLPLIPGTFEAVLMTPELSTRNAWHKRFAEIFERLWDSGFMKDYVRTSVPPVRFLPVARASSTLFTAWPSDRLEEYLEPYELFGLGQCQCRMAMQLTGKGCSKPMLSCVAIGPLARLVIARGMMRKADKAEILEVKRHAEDQGLVTWLANELGDRRGNVCCSCCGCCCHALRSITELSAPALVSAPHFVPVKHDAACTSCDRCVRVCPTGAWSAVSGSQPAFNKPRCIGCGLCAVHCRAGALELTTAEGCVPPENSWTSLIARMAPGYFANATRVWLRRLVG
jgi:Pyruvate/2-oxoacid:ferredoxin oxidoreductase delta subunit